jgi:aerobic C4-dicarboxylate transport protein
MSGSNPDAVENPPAPVVKAVAAAARLLYVQVLVAIAAGILLGWLWPALGAAMQPLSTVFIRLIRSVVPLIVFATIVVGIAKIGDLRRVGTVAWRALLCFELVSSLALVIGLVVGNLWRPGSGLHIDPASLDPTAAAGWVGDAKSLTIVQFLMQMVPVNLVGAIAEGQIMPVLVMGVLVGVALCQMGERGAGIVDFIEDGMHALFNVVRIIMYLAPLAAFAAMAFTIGKYGFRPLAGLGSLVAEVYLTAALFVLVVFGAVARLCGLRLTALLRYFKDELLIAFSATSGEAMIPRAIGKLERLGCRRDVVGLVLPTGFSFNMDGTAIYMAAALLFIADATGMHLGLKQQLAMLFVMLFTSKGAAGVTGGGFVALAATLPAVGAVPVGGLALLLGVERFMSEIRAVTNLFGNIFATVVVARWLGALDLPQARSVLADIPAVPRPWSRLPARLAGVGVAGLAAMLVALWLVRPVQSQRPPAPHALAALNPTAPAQPTAPAAHPPAPPAATAAPPAPPKLRPPARHAASLAARKPAWQSREIEAGTDVIQFHFKGRKLYDWTVSPDSDTASSDSK